MASAKPASTTRTRGGRGPSGQDADLEISTARWAGVALVIAALLGAIVLAVVSPSVPTAQDGAQDGAAAVPVGPSPRPSASTPVDAPLPEAQPEITYPTVGSQIGDWEIAVDVTVPKEKLPRRDLTLVILSGDRIIGELEGKPKLGGKNVVPGVRLTPGFHELTAALRGPGGLGPKSVPVTVTMDRDAPKLEVTSPAGKTKTLDDTVEVTGTSEVGAEVRIINDAAGFESAPLTVGPDGDFDLVVRLAMGRNVIVVDSVNQAGRTQEDSVVVVRKDGKPKISLEAPESIKGASLPKTVKIVVDVTDTDGDAMADAEVSYHLQGVGWPTEVSEATTNDKGRSTWKVPVKPVTGSDAAVSIAVSVTSPTGQTRTAKHQIKIK